MSKNFASMIKTPSRPSQPFYSQTTDDLDAMLGFMGSLFITRPLWTKIVRDGYHRRPLLDTKSNYYQDMSTEDFLGMTVLEWIEVEDRMKADPDCDRYSLLHDRMSAYIKYGNISLEQAIAAIGAVNVARIMRDYLEDNIGNIYAI